MSFELARVDVEAAVQAGLAAWAGPALPLVFQNRTTLDVDRQTNPYLCVDIHFMDGEQLSMGSPAVLADYGQVHLVVHAPAKSGLLASARILDHFRRYIELKAFVTIRTRAAKGASVYTKDGWQCLPLIVPFWYHRLVT